MTLEELEKEAKRLGYKLIKDEGYKRFLPCTCGCNKREHLTKWTGYEMKVILRCVNCGREAAGNSDKDAKRNWNKMIEEEQNGESQTERSE